MLGIHIGNGGKHAVVYTGIESGCFQFLNNKWLHDPSAETFSLSETALIEAVDDSCVIATLYPIAPRSVSAENQLDTSCSVLEQYRQELHRVCAETLPIEELRSLLNPLFRALLLDGITMLTLLGEDRLVSKLSSVQCALLHALRSGTAQLRLSDHLDMEILDASISKYQAIIQAKL